MRRLAPFMLWLLLATLPQPALADITAEYYVWGPIGPTMKVQVAHNGDARLELGGHLAAIRRNGVMYLVRGDRRGPFVVRKDEFDRIEAQLERDRGPLVSDAEMEGARIVEAGEETVGGRRGTVLLIQGPGERGGDPETAFVVSEDPDLRPVGEVVGQFFGGPGGPIPMPGLDRIADIFARGTLIRMWVLLRLERTSSERIPPTAFDLPGPIVSGEEARSRLGPAW